MKLPCTPTNVLFLAALLCAGCPEDQETGEGADGGLMYADAGNPPARFEAQGEGMVEDLETGLLWQQTIDDFKMNHELAEKYCPGLALGDQGLRLPSKVELESIVDERFWPTIDPEHFPNSYLGYYWTSDAAGGGLVWTVNFDTGESEALAADADYVRTRCVK